MNIQGWYYLHQNGSLIYRVNHDGVAGDIRDSDFAIGMWPLDTKNRETAWRILVEGLAAGANPERVAALARLWQCDDKDADIYASHVGCNIYLDGDRWCATPLDFVNLQESPAGFGASKLEAMADLCRALGYKPSKTWGAEFSYLLRRQENSREGVGA